VEPTTNIRQVAAACGLSTATVSYVLNNGPRAVKPETRERVIEAMRELNYHPSAIARRMQGKRVNTIGVVALHRIPSIFKDPYFNTVISGIIDAGAEFGQSVTIFTGQGWTDPVTSVPNFTDGRCDGLVILAASREDRTIPELKLRSVPFVLINETGTDPEVSSAGIDDVDAARQMVRHLISMGHRRIAHFAGDYCFQSAVDRLSGYRLALEEAGIAFDPNLVFAGRYGYGSGFDRATERAAWLRERATAVFCASDWGALGALRGFEALGLNVPRDMSIAGINGDHLGRDQELGLTTMDQNLETLGYAGVSVLMRLISGNETGPIRVVRPLILREGKTVARIAEPLPNDCSL